MTVTLREQQLRFREEAILEAANTLLAQRGYDAMTVDDVAAALGIAKTSLYKHFESKEALAAAAMIRLLERAQQVAAAQGADHAPVDKLRAVLRWALMEQLAGRMPKLPSTHSGLRGALLRDKRYMARLMQLSETLGAWIEAAQAEGAIAPQLPGDVVLYTLYARTCDPVVDLLKTSGGYTDEQIAGLMLTLAFDGLTGRAAAPRASAARTKKR